MIKELEALKTIKIKCHPNSNPSPLVDDALEVVEQALIKLQEQKKVLKIVFEKKVDIPYLCELFECIGNGEDTIESALKLYNDSVKHGINTHQLIQEEFELLKRYYNE